MGGDADTAEPVGDGAGVSDEAGLPGTGAADETSSAVDVRMAIGILAPLVLLAVVVAGVILFPPFGTLGGAAPPDVAVTHATLPSDDTVVLHVTNNGPNPVTIEQVLVNDAYWAFTVGDGGEGARTLGALESTTIEIPYHWQPNWDIHAALVLDDGATFGHTIVAPQTTDGLTPTILGTLAVVGLFVGVIPVVLGMAWYPFMRRLSDRWLRGVLALAGGVLAFLAVDAGFEALEVAGEIPAAFEGSLLVVVGVVGTLLLVQAIAARFREDGRVSPLGLAYLVALSIGLHNLAEGLAIGGAVALGNASLGAFLVIGFMIHNVTEGPAIVAPVAREKRPHLAHFAGLGLLAGAPVILGGWIGSIALGPTLGALFLAIGVGAILQVLWEMGGLIRASGRLATGTNLLGFALGFAVMYATDLLVAL
jgi:zinc transporter ZupT